MTLGAILVPIVGLVVGIGGLWLSWKLVVQLPADKHPGDEPDEGDDADDEAGDERP